MNKLLVAPVRRASYLEASSRWVGMGCIAINFWLGNGANKQLAVKLPANQNGPILIFHKWARLERAHEFQQETIGLELIRILQLEH